MKHCPSLTGLFILLLTSGTPGAGKAGQTPPPTVAPEHVPAITSPDRPLRERNRPIQLTGHHARLRQNLNTGYERLQKLDLSGAAQAYREALTDDARNTDALLALAAISWHQGKRSESIRWRQQAFAADPSDLAVQAAILGSALAGIDPQKNEARLRTLLSNQPDSAPLHFALGNLLARAERWPAARQAYLNALAADGDNPDYLCNLAISFDQLQQTTAAVHHYRLALSASEHRPHAFLSDQIRIRLADLAP